MVGLAIMVAAVVGAEPSPWLEPGPYAWGERPHDGSIVVEDTTIPLVGDIHYPASSAEPDAPISTGGPFPIMLFAHAAGVEYDSYEYMLSRLASRGIIAVSVDHCDPFFDGGVPELGGGNPEDLHELLFLALVEQAVLWNGTPGHVLHGAIDTERIAFGGHSHGCAGALRAMKRYRPVLPGAELEITSICHLAACPNWASTVTDYLNQYAGHPACQVIYGSRDNDGCVSNGQAIAIYEPGDRPRHMAYVPGVNHYGFTDDGPLGTSTVSRDAAQQAFTAPFIAFHEYILNDRHSALPFLRNDVALLTAGLDSWYQFHEPNALVIDDFQDAGKGDPTGNTLGLAVIAGDLETVSEIDTLDTGRTLYHPGRGLEIAWSDQSTDPRLTEQLDEPGGAGLDASDRLALSLRALQLYGDPLNADGVFQDFRVGVIDADGDAAHLALSETTAGAAGGLRPPVPPAPGIGWKSVYQSFRFMLEDYVTLNAALDLDRLAAVELIFDTTDQGRVVIDDIELVGASCAEDTGGNGLVDVDDLLSVILDWGTDGSANNGDVDDSGVVDADDVVAVITAWGPC